MRQQSLTRCPIDFGDSSADSPVPNVEAPKEIYYNPDDTCSKHPCYNKKTGICLRLTYKIDAKLASKQRLCDILDREVSFPCWLQAWEKTEDKRVNRP